MREGARTALVALLAVFAVGVLGLVVVAAADDRELAFTLGVRATQVAAEVEPGQTACQQPIDVPADAGTVRFPVGTLGRPGPELLVVTRAGGRVVGQDVVPGGYGDNTTAGAAPGGIVAGRRIAVCVRNEGSRPVAVLGGAPQAARTSALRLDGRDQGTDLSLVFERGESRSMLAAVGDAVERASLFRPSWVGTGLMWALAALLVTALPLALLFALRSALRPED